MNNQFKAQATAIIIAIIALIIAAGSGYLVLHNRSQKVTVETTTTILTTTTEEPTTTITEETTTTKSKVTTNILYKTTYDGSLMSRLYKSIDGGKHWILLVEAYKGKILFAFDRHNPNIVYYTEGTFNMMAEGGGVSIYKSVDGGSHWKDISSGIITEYKKEHGFLGYISSLSIDPNDSNIIYVTADGEHFKSIDGGNTWTKLP